LCGPPACLPACCVLQRHEFCAACLHALCAVLCACPERFSRETQLTSYTLKNSALIKKQLLWL
jgi:ABC-type uncharacterized transport system auxiliary subunit